MDLKGIAHFLKSNFQYDLSSCCLFVPRSSKEMQVSTFQRSKHDVTSIESGGSQKRYSSDIVSFVAGSCESGLEDLASF